MVGADQSPEAPDPGTDQPVVAAPSPPPSRHTASKAKFVLPPIRTGRKTPAVPRVAPESKD